MTTRSLNFSPIGTKERTALFFSSSSSSSSCFFILSLGRTFRPIHGIYGPRNAVYTLCYTRRACRREDGDATITAQDGTNVCLIRRASARLRESPKRRYIARVSARDFPLHERSGTPTSSLPPLSFSLSLPLSLSSHVFAPIQHVYIRTKCAGFSRWTYLGGRVCVCVRVCACVYVCVRVSVCVSRDRFDD